jgi:hypothetical protein
MVFANIPILKYILFGLVVGCILKYVPTLNLTNENIVRIVSLCILVMVFCDIFLKKTVEGVDMSNGEEYPEEEIVQIVQPAAEAPCKPCMSTQLPNKYGLNRCEEDYGKTGLSNIHDDPINPLIQQGQFTQQLPDWKTVKEELITQSGTYHTSDPGYYLLNNGNYSANGIPYEKASSMIAASKLNDLYNQHNFNIKSSPHTHLGKARGYLNWDKFYN